MNIGPTPHKNPNGYKLADSDELCPKCKTRLHYRLWDSLEEAYTDVRYLCFNCGYEHWYEGSDY